MPAGQLTRGRVRLLRNQTIQLVRRRAVPPGIGPRRLRQRVVVAAAAAAAVVMAPPGVARGVSTRGHEHERLRGSGGASCCCCSSLSSSVQLDGAAAEALPAHVHGDLAAPHAQIEIVRDVGVAAGAPVPEDARLLGGAVRARGTRRGLLVLCRRGRGPAGSAVHGPGVVLDGLVAGLALLEEDQRDGREQEQEARAGTGADPALGCSGEA